MNNQENNWVIPSWDALFMKHVYLIASKSKDTKTKIGAVLVRDNSIISEGYNGIPRKVIDNIDVVPQRYERPEKYFWQEHAERNCIYHCARNGISTEGTTLYTQGLSCADCTRAIINSGISEIVLHETFEHQLTPLLGREKWSESGSRSDIMLFESRIKVRIFNGVIGCKTMVDGKIFDV
jgi:dCMP deaminase